MRKTEIRKKKRHVFFILYGSYIVMLRLDFGCIDKNTKYEKNFNFYSVNKKTMVSPKNTNKSRHVMEEKLQKKLGRMPKFLMVRPDFRSNFKL